MPELRGNCQPQLTIVSSQGSFWLSWPHWAVDWTVEQSDRVDEAAVWSPVTGEYATNGAIRFAQVLTNEGRFFRLRKNAAFVAGLSGAWDLDEASGDVSGDGCGGMMSLAGTSWAGGRFGAAALQFSGAGDGTSRAWFSNANHRALPAGDAPFSVSLWFNPESSGLAPAPGAQTLFGTSFTETSGWHVALHTPGPGTNHIVFTARGTDSLTVTGETLLLPGQWRQLTVTYSGIGTFAGAAESEGRVYLDGALLGTGRGTVVTPEGTITLGGGVAGQASFAGKIDALRTYTNCLTAEDISLAGHWRFNESAGAFTADSSLRGNHGMLSEAHAPRVAGRNGLAVDLSAAQLVVSNSNHEVLPPSGGAFSISTWLKPGMLADGPSALMSCADGTNNGWQVSIESAGLNQRWLRLSSISSGGTLDLRAPIALTNGSWTKLDVTYNGGIATLYANGRKLGSANGAIRASRGPLIVGGALGLPGAAGAIDELKIYHHERGESEIGPVAVTMWETVFMNSASNLVLQGGGPAGRPLTYAVVDVVAPTNGTVTISEGVVTYQAGARKGPDAFAFTVSDGEFTSEPAIVTVSVVQPHWLSPAGGAVEPLDGSSPERAWAAGSADAVGAIWRTNTYYDCFFYAPGVYETRGWKVHERGTVNPGCKHIGSGTAGAGATTLRLVDTWDAWGEGTIFAHLHGGVSGDGFEVRQMVLDCNAVNNPKYSRGEPVWLRIPLAATTRVDTVTLRWASRTLPGTAGFPFSVGRAAEFRVCTRAVAGGGYVTNCISSTSTGQVDVVRVDAVTDEIVVYLDRRATLVDFYGLTEIEVSGEAGTMVSLPTATIPGGGRSELNAQHSILSAVDEDWGTAWSSGSEKEVHISLPLAPGTLVTRLDLYWNCQMVPGLGRFGPASNYVIRARDSATGAYIDVPFVRHARTQRGHEVNIFGTAEAPLTITADELVLVLRDKAPNVDFYSLLNVTAQYWWALVPIRVPTSKNALGWAGYFPMMRAFDGNLATHWASGSQGMVSAVSMAGNNVKFKDLKIIGFGTKALRECFPMFIHSNSGRAEGVRLGNILIENCVFTSPAPNNPDGLTTISLHAAPPDTMTNAVIRGCQVLNMAPYFRYANAMSAIHVENSIVENCGTGVYFEPDSVLDDIGPVLIRSNRFVNVRSGIFLQSHPAAAFDSLTCLANEIVLTGGAGTGVGSCDTCGGGRSAWMTNMTVLNNVIRYGDWAPRPGSGDWGLFYSEIHNAVFANNVVALGNSHPVRVRQHPASQTFPPPPWEDCDQRVIVSSDPPTFATNMDDPPPPFKRAWANNRDLSGNLLPVRFYLYGADQPASQQQWPE